MVNFILQTIWLILAFVNAYRGDNTAFLLCLILSMMFGLTNEIKDHISKKFEEYL